MEKRSSWDNLFLSATIPVCPYSCLPPFAPSPVLVDRRPRIHLIFLMSRLIVVALIFGLGFFLGYVFGRMGKKKDDSGRVY